MLGVFVWVVLSVAPASSLSSSSSLSPSPSPSSSTDSQQQGTPHGRFVKSLLAVGLVQMGLEDWDVADKAMRGALRLVEWLSGGAGEEDGLEEGRTHLGINSD